MTAVPSAKAKAAIPPPPADAAAAATVGARRRVPGWLLAVIGIGLALGYGVGIEHMHMGPPLVMLGLGGMTLVLAALALWRVIDPLTRGEAPAAVLPARAPARLRELEREKQAVLKAIKEIELDYQMRKIADGDYREMIGRYRARAMRLISELEAGDNYRQLIERELKDRLHALAEAGTVLPNSMATTASEPATATAPTATATTAPTAAAPGPRCARCATANDADAHFCKSCGARLSAAS